MLVLESGDKIRGDASAASVVDYTIHGLDNNALKQLADGQLSDSTGDLYTADSIDVVSAITVVNTDSSARTLNLFLLPSGGTARRIIAKDFSLGSGYSLHYDGVKISVLTGNGSLVYSTAAPSQVESPVGIGGAAGVGVPTLRRCSINSSTGVVTVEAGDDLMFNSAADISPDQQIIASKIWNSVWNDIADFRKLSDSLVYGKCYYDTLEGAKICNVRCQKGVIGIASNTFGQALGYLGSESVPIAISGWVLAYVDQEYEIGTPLTNDEWGILTEMTLEEKQNYPERMVAIYRNLELESFWGPPDNKIEVDGRHWVKVK
jgi:hypothetical protein